MMTKVLYLALAITTFIVGLTIVYFVNSMSFNTQIDKDQYCTLQRVEYYIKPEAEPRLPVDDSVITKLKVRGIGLDSKVNDVLKKLGKPLKISKTGFDACADSRNKFFSYPGLEIGFLEGDRKGDFTVYDLEISSPKWKLDSGLGVGSTKSEVIKEMGENTPSKYEGYDNLIYSGASGVSFLMKTNKVSWISWRYATC